MGGAGGPASRVAVTSRSCRSWRASESAARTATPEFEEDAMPAQAAERHRPARAESRGASGDALPPARMARGGGHRILRRRRAVARARLAAGIAVEWRKVCRGCRAVVSGRRAPLPLLRVGIGGRPEAWAVAYGVRPRRLRRAGHGGSVLRRSHVKVNALDEKSRSWPPAVRRSHRLAPGSCASPSSLSSIGCGRGGCLREDRRRLPRGWMFGSFVGSSSALGVRKGVEKLQPRHGWTHARARGPGKGRLLGDTLHGVVPDYARGRWTPWRVRRRPRRSSRKPPSLPEQPRRDTACR